MAGPLRTNPVYAHLAYQKTIIAREISFLRRTYLGDELSDPREVLICEEVFQQDQKVSQEAIQHRIERLVEESSKIEVELRQFDLVPKAQREYGKAEPKKPKGGGKPGQSGGSPGSKENGRH